MTRAVFELTSVDHGLPGPGYAGAVVVAAAGAFLGSTLPPNVYSLHKHVNCTPGGHPPTPHALPTQTRQLYSRGPPSHPSYTPYTNTSIVLQGSTLPSLVHSLPLSMYGKFKMGTR